ncbi:MAG: sulfotransferase family 2 domain-containing protein [Pseudomonadota bacterium]
MREPVIIHLHVPKCAGGAVNVVLRTYFGDRVLHQAGEPARKILSEHADEYDAVMGHNMWGVHEYFSRKYIYFSAVREPIERICSYFNYLHTSPATKMHSMIKGVLTDLNDIKRETFDTIPPLGHGWRNAMCRAYTGFADVTRRDWDDIWPIIKHRMDNDLLLVKDLEGIEHWLREHGMLTGDLRKQKVTKIHAFDDYEIARVETLTPRTINLLRVSNSHDLRLIDALRERGDVTTF